MTTTPLTPSVQRGRFGRPERTEIRPHFARDVLDDMKAAYFAADRPWVVGFSDGKASTALVQLLDYMLARLPADQPRKHVYVLASDTHVEAPYIPARIRKELGRRRQIALKLSARNVQRKAVPAQERNHA